MNKKILILLVITFCLGQTQKGNAQANYLLEIGEIDSVYSEILQELREIYIQFPESYNPESNRKYPVIYVLDGGNLLNAVNVVHDYYWGGFMPEMIIVGISNAKNRTRDLTTSKIESWRGVEYHQEHGEAGNFTQFIEKELIPFIENKYPTTNYRTLIGHSYGGLFAINTLINHTHLFQNYLAIDPSLDWDNQKLIKQSKAILQNKDFMGKSLFISLGGQLHMQNAEVTIDNVMQDTSEFTLFARSNILFSEWVKENEKNGLNFNWKFYKNDLHGSIPLPSIMDGLITVFEWYQMENTDKINSFDTSKEELFGIIKYREKKLKDHFGYSEPPYPEELLNMSGYMNMDMHQTEKALMYFELAIEYYPHSANAYDSMADYYEAQNDYVNALKNVIKAFEISGSDNYKQRMDELKDKQ